MLKKLFETVDRINEKIEEDNVLEISVKQSTMTFILEGYGILSRKDFDCVDNLFDVHISQITAFQDTIRIHFNDLSEMLTETAKNDEDFITLYSLIFKLRDTLCTCPALEYVVAPTYVKVYIDLPNIHVQDLQKVERLFNSQGVLEINNSRPYLLYVKDW